MNVGSGRWRIAELDQQLAADGQVGRSDEDVEVGRPAGGQAAVQALRQDQPLDRDRRHARGLVPIKDPTEGVGHPRVLGQGHVAAPGGPLEPVARNGDPAAAGRLSARSGSTS